MPASPKAEKPSDLLSARKKVADRLNAKKKAWISTPGLVAIVLAVVCLTGSLYLLHDQGDEVMVDLTDEYYDGLDDRDEPTVQQRFRQQQKEEAAAKRRLNKEKRKEKEKKKKEKEEKPKKAKKKAKEVNEGEEGEPESSEGGKASTLSVTVEQDGIEITSTKQAKDKKGRKGQYNHREEEDDEDDEDDDEDEEDEERASPDQLWQGDDEIAKLAEGITCDWPILSALDRNGDVDPNFEVPSHLVDRFPYIIRGLTVDWPARNDDNWQYYKILERFGNRSIPSDAGNSYVSGGGHSETSYPLSQLLTSLRAPKEGADEAFTFDPGIMDRIPELRQEIEVPRWFSNWMSQEHEEQKMSWHMLSLAGSRNGLPFHTHGETYMSLIHGRKWWMIYPPGAQPSPETFAITNPIQNVEYYVKHVLPTIQHLPKPPMLEEVTQPANVEGYQPMQCIQEPGDILYLPGSWQHQTLNIGEAIGLGGQAQWEPHISLTQKYEMTLEQLKRSPKNINFHRVQLMTVHAYAEYEQERLDAALGPQTSKGMVAFKSNYSSDTDWSYKKFPYAHEKEVTDAEALKLGETHFSSLIMKTEDTWLLLFVPAQPGDGNKQARTTFSSIWDAVAKKMRGYLSVGFSVVPLEMWSNPQWAKEMGLSSEESYNPSEDGEDKPQVYKMKLILGTRDRPAKMMTQAKILKAYGMDLDYDLVRTNINNICKFAYETMKNTTGTKEGGVSSTTAKVKRLHEEGEKHAYEVLKQQPYHPEMIGLLTTSLRAMNKTETHGSALEYFEKKFQPLFRNITKGEPAHGMSRVGLASAYHKLADAAGEIGDLDMAIRILERSLNLAPGYQKSLADLAMNYITLNESAKVEQTVARAEENGMPRTHQKFEIVHAYLSDLERNKTGGYTDEEEKEQVEGTYTGQSVEGGGGGGGGGGGEAAYGGGGSGSGSQGQEEQYQRGGLQEDQYGSPYGGASEEGGFSREGHSLRLDR